MSGTFVLSGRLDILTANELGFALYSPIYADPARPPSNARFIFLDPHATEFFRDWDKIANDAVALLRAGAGRDPSDRQLSDLIEACPRTRSHRRTCQRPERVVDQAFRHRAFGTAGHRHVSVVQPSPTQASANRTPVVVADPRTETQSIETGAARATLSWHYSLIRDESMTGRRPLPMRFLATPSRAGGLPRAAGTSRFE